MKDTKFIELLNLYLDHQITPEEAALLETEIRRNPERRRLYREYCLMHKACSRLAEDFRESAPPARRPATTAIPRRRGNWFYATGLAVAAACVALVVVNMPGTDATGPVVSPESAAPVVVATSHPIPAPVIPALASRNSDLHTVFSTRTLVQWGEDSAREAMFTGGDRLDWINQMQVAPLRSDSLVFESAPASDTPEARPFRSQRPFYGTAEMTAFQFQR